MGRPKKAEPTMYKRGERWWADFTCYRQLGGTRQGLQVDGEPYATTNEKIAQHLFAVQRAEFERLTHRKVFTGKGVDKSPLMYAARHVQLMETNPDYAPAYVRDTERDLERLFTKTSLKDVECISDISRQHVSDAILEVRKWTGKQGEPISPLTVRRVMQELSGLLSRAVHDEILVANPCQRHRDMPSPQSPEPAESLEPEEVGRLLVECARPFRNQHFSPFFFERVMTLAYTGLRRGEMARLWVDDFDFENGVVKVHKHRTSLGATAAHNRGKTPRSLQREVPFWSHLMDVVGESFYRHPRTGQLAFPSYKAGPGGEEQEVAGMHEPLSRMARAADIRGADGEFKEVHPHTLRHSYASTRLMMYERNGNQLVQVHALTVSRELGHTNTATTENVYSHVQRGRLKNVTVLDYRP